MRGPPFISLSLSLSLFLFSHVTRQDRRKKGEPKPKKYISAETIDMLLWDGYSSSKGVDSLLLRERNLEASRGPYCVARRFLGLSPSATPLFRRRPA